MLFRRFPCISTASHIESAVPQMCPIGSFAVPHITMPHITRFPWSQTIPNAPGWCSVSANRIKDFPGHCSAIFQGFFFFAIAVIVGLYQSLHLHRPVSTTRQACDMTHGGSGQFFRRFSYVRLNAAVAMRRDVAGRRTITMYRRVYQSPSASMMMYDDYCDGVPSKRFGFSILLIILLPYFSIYYHIHP